MFVLMEVRETGCMDLGTKRDSEGRQYAEAKPEDFHETPLDVFVAAIQLLQDKGYDPRYSLPLSGGSSSNAFLIDYFGLCPNKWGFVDDAEAVTGPGIRFTITKHKSEQTEMEKWKASMPRAVNFVLPVMAIGRDDLDVALEKWLQEMPKE